MLRPVIQVSVHTEDPIASSGREALPQCLALTGVDTVGEMAHPAITVSEVRQDRACAVGAAIIHKQNLPIAFHPQLFLPAASVEVGSQLCHSLPQDARF